MKLKKISLEDTKSENINGTILSIDKESIVVGCKKGSLRIYKLQPPSKKEMDSFSYVNGKRLSIEDSIL
jgi:methionyl-tRNA formyltransferase